MAASVGQAGRPAKRPVLTRPVLRCYRSRTVVIKITCLACALAQTLAFDVASVKRTAPDIRISEFQMRQGGRLFVLGMTLRDLIRRGYGPEGIERNDQVLGGPAWVATDRFDIEAATDAPIVDEVRTTRMLTMLRSLLENRFRLRVHVEQRESEVFSLVAANASGALGRSIRPSTIDCQTTVPGTIGVRPDSPRWCGVSSSPGRIVGKGQTMSELAMMLSGYPSVGRAVRDKSSVPGRFEFQIEFTPRFIAGDAPGTLIPNPQADAGTDIFTAMQEQLGLKLQNDRARMSYAVVDHAEPPTEN